MTDLFGVHPKEANERIISLDRARSAYYKYYTGKNWEDVSNYDLCINTSKISFDKAVDIIVDYMKQTGYLSTEEN